jgi:hypothetical protein
MAIHFVKHVCLRVRDASFGPHGVSVTQDLEGMVKWRKASKEERLARIVEGKSSWPPGRPHQPGEEAQEVLPHGASLSSAHPNGRVGQAVMMSLWRVVLRFCHRCAKARRLCWAKFRFRVSSPSSYTRRASVGVCSIRVQEDPWFDCFASGRILIIAYSFILATWKMYGWMGAHNRLPTSSSPSRRRSRTIRLNPISLTRSPHSPQT